ncbi:MAG: hypothetical protein ACYTBY_10655 [Planctomycetota bacterium]|jgi:hypothetical protein
MKLRGIGSIASLALLLALTGCGGSGGGEEEVDIVAKGPPKSSAPRASIGISNDCALKDDEAVLVVTTTIIDKTLDKDKDSTPPEWGVVDPDGKPLSYRTAVQAQQKPGGNHWSSLGNPVPLNNDSTLEPYLAPADPNLTTINLCAAGFDINDNTVALNASVSVEVRNSEKGTYETSQCDDATKLKISGADLKGRCSSGP